MKMFAAILVAAAVVWLAPPGHPPQHHDSNAAVATADHSVNVDAASATAPAEGPTNYAVRADDQNWLVFAWSANNPCESRAPDKLVTAPIHALSYTMTANTHNYESDVDLASLRDRPEPLSRQPDDI